MSDSYKVGKATVTPSGGGWFTIAVAGAEDVRVQGKEAADAKAAELGGAGDEDDGTMTPQDPGIVTSTLGAAKPADGDNRTAAEKVQEANAGIAPTPPPAPPANDGAPVKDPSAKAAADKAKQDASAEADAHAKTKAALAEAQARVDELEKAMKPIATVVVNAAPDAPAIPAQVPREFAGHMDADTRKAMKAMGLGTTRIVLEENDSIPPTGLFLGHNGRSFMIVPGEEVDVPDFLLGVLDDAVMAAPVVDNKSQKVLGYRNRSKYPYRRVNDKG